MDNTQIQHIMVNEIIIKEWGFITNTLARYNDKNINREKLTVKFMKKDSGFLV